MKIDYMQNPLAIVKRFDILYGGEKKDLHLEGRIHAHIEEGFDEVSWFDGEVRYPGKCEIGGTRYDKFYQALKRGATTLMGADKKLRDWCKSMDLEISDIIIETVGVS